MMLLIHRFKGSTIRRSTERKMKLKILKPKSNTTKSTPLTVTHMAPYTRVSSYRNMATIWYGTLKIGAVCTTSWSR